MDAPQIQYARAADGVNIAYWTMGDGPGVIYMSGSPAFGHIEGEWQLPGISDWFNALGTVMRVVKYDNRCSGLSDQTERLSLDDRLSDIDAVADASGLRTFSLVAPFVAGPAGIAYAATRPERVSHLILWCSGASGDEVVIPLIARLHQMAEDDFETYARTLASVIYDWGDADAARRMAEVVIRTSSAAAQRQAMDSIRLLDASSMLSDVHAPTLVIYRQGVPWPEAASRRMAAGIGGARFVTADGEGAMLFVGGDVQKRMRLLTDFMGVPAPDLVTTARANADAAPAGTAIILFADIVDSTAMTEMLGDAAFRERARQLDERLRGAIRTASGTPVEGKLLGDGVLAVFSSARQAIDAALHCADAGGEFGLRLHLGIHAGDVIREGDNVFGGAVNIASRISGLSAPDEVLVSATVRDLARTSAGVTFDDRGEHALKGVGEAVRVYAVRARDGL